ncbi:hypothetical protein ACFLZM_07730, partial [Thermodesulfobacteriota bacterium]
MRDEEAKNKKKTEKELEASNEAEAERLAAEAENENQPTDEKVDLSEYKRDELNKMATEMGIENSEEYKNKAELIEAMEATPEEESEPAESEGEDQSVSGEERA